jgi:hypothetical protein
MHSFLFKFTLIINSVLLFFFLILGLQVPARCISDFALFNVRSSRQKRPSARCESAVSVVGTLTCSEPRTSP